jgi:hypothetical protein
LHSCLVNSVIATHVGCTSISTSDPRVERSLLTLAQLNNNFYVGSDNPLSTLPIELLSFNAILQERRVELKWSTASELNNDFFTVERALNVEKFEPVAVVKGQGTKGSQTDYSSIDENPVAGTSYYRLKQTDFDGNISYSKLVSVDVPETATWIVYPNPSNGSDFTIGFAPVDLGKDAYIKVQDMGGKDMFQVMAPNLNSTQVKVVSPQTLSPGLYIISIAVEQQIARQKLMVR